MNTRLAEPAPPQPRRPEAAARSAVAAAASEGPRLDAARPSVASAPGGAPTLPTSNSASSSRGPVRSDPVSLRPARNSCIPPTPMSVQGLSTPSSAAGPAGEQAHATADVHDVEPLLQGIPSRGSAMASLGSGPAPAPDALGSGTNRTDRSPNVPSSSVQGLRPACAAVAQAVRSCSPALPPTNTAPLGLVPAPSEAATFAAATPGGGRLASSSSPLSPGRGQSRSPSPSPATAARERGAAPLPPSCQGAALPQDSRSNFSGFREQLEQESKARKVQEYAGIKSINALCSRVQSYMEQEVQRASESHRNLQSALEHRMAEAQGALESMFLSKFDKVHSSVVALDDRLKAVEGSYSQACDNYINEMKEETLCIRAESRDFYRRFQDELAKRRETEGATMQRLRELEVRCATDFSNESRGRHEYWDNFLQEVQASCFAWEEANRAYQDDTMEKVQSCKDRLDEAVRQREEADDDIVAALNQYTQVLQEAVASASRGSLIAVTTL